jgi:hypothetical protein
MKKDHFKIEEKNGAQLIYDPFRKKQVVLTPEEWVRQQILDYLVTEKKYPASMISVEKQIKVGNLNKRYDVLIYQKETPWMIIECKEENEVLNDNVLHQLLSYNSILKVSFLVITNGHQLHCYDVANSKWNNSFPDYL